jgi:pyruvate-formate lyase-activating enzyme
MSVISEVMEMEELMDIYKDIMEELKDKPILLNAFKQLIKNEDLDYETESTASSEEYSDDEVIDEKIILKKDGEGFMSID